jgi:hypothetical protein
MRKLNSLLNILKKDNWLGVPDTIKNSHYYKKIDEFTFLHRTIEFSYQTIEEALKDFENWHEELIDIRDYTKDEVVDLVGLFDYELKENYNLLKGDKTFCSNESKMLISKCLFGYRQKDSYLLTL